MRVLKNPDRDGIEGSYVFYLLISPKLYFIPMGFNDIRDVFGFTDMLSLRDRSDRDVRCSSCSIP